MSEFEKSKYYVGYRPTIGWIVAIGLFLLFPVQTVIIYVSSIMGYGVVLPHQLLSSMSIPLVSLAVGIMGIRTYEKLNKRDDTLLDL